MDTLPEIYAPTSGAKIAAAADMIRAAARLLDGCGGKYVIAAVEAVDGSEHITSALADRLATLAAQVSA